MTRFMRQERRSATGVLRAFSLLELTMVLAIMGVVAAMAVPRYAAFLSRSHLNVAITRIGTDLERLRRTAKQTGASQTVTFIPASDSYAVTGCIGNVERDLPVFQYGDIVQIATNAQTRSV